MYKESHLIENSFQRLNGFRRIATRYDKTKRDRSTVSIPRAIYFPVYF
jgi:hypothetical protein